MSTNGKVSAGSGRGSTFLDVFFFSVSIIPDEIR